MAKIKDICGERFSKLEAVQYNATTKKWLCQCDCGNLKEIAYKHLQSGATKSCGCMRIGNGSRKKNLTGHIFGRLTVIKERGRNNEGRIIWLCQCECGNIKNTGSRELLSGNSNSCGCLKKEVERTNLKNGYEKKRVGKVVTSLFTAKLRKDNTSGIKGVYRRGSRWYAKIRVDGKEYTSKTFDSKLEAAAARKKLEFDILKLEK